MNFSNFEEGNEFWNIFQKVHTFQASLEAVLAQLCDAEHAQKALTNSAPSQEDPAVFRNQLKVTNQFVCIYL